MVVSSDTAGEMSSHMNKKKKSSLHFFPFPIISLYSDLSSNYSTKPTLEVTLCTSRKICLQDCITGCYKQVYISIPNKVLME